MKIIVVEDEAVIRQGIRSILEDISPDGFAIAEFDNAGDAWTYMQRHVPNMVITDIRMREMDGLTLIRKIRQLYADMPVVIISGYEEFEYAQQAIRYKVTDYLLKPINRRALISLVTGVASRLAPQAARDTAEDEEDPGLPKSKSGDNRRLIRKVKESIDANPDGDLRLQVLAEYAGINAAYLSQLFKAETGRNLSDYIAGVRLERAKHLLATTHLKIYDVAHQSGYQSPKHFMLVFKQHVGKTPSEYREQSQ
ncbi:response regulator [Cohnella sp. LGH]|uniref:response regulator transcription factor n=1 Tax=Cohnella sp. LGH TaxID=1619153 RepID=UPI001ADB7D26|nr:response regulator [Cohnella sp. LGH]QTH44251.1 response regulator [Cohnella sp. LGH]